MPLILPRPPWPIINETATDAPTRQLTVAAENTPIPILYGEDQLGARLLAVKVDEPNNRVVMSLGWCLGEIEGIDQIYFDGVAAPAGVTFTHYLGTPSQGIDPTLQGAISGYSDTNVITVGGVNVGTAYTVAIIPKGVKVPRNITADLRGLKLYDPRQNRIRQSETYSNSAWGKTRVTTSNVAGTSPAGAAITKLAETTGSGTHLISITESASSSTAYRASIWIQAAGRDKGRFTLAGESIDFDLTAVTAGASHIIAEGNGWYRIDLKATTGGAASSISYQLNILNASGNDSYTGNGSSGFNLGGSLIVQSAESYPYVKTTTAHVTPTTAYSTNPSLALGNFYASTVYGKGQTPNYGSTAKCAIANDELVSGSARRKIGLAIERIVSVEQWVETIRTYAACFIDPSGDKPTFIPDRTAPTRRTLTESDIVEGTFRLTRRSGRDVPTVITVIYTDKTVTPYRDAEATAKISGIDTGTVQRREITLRLPGIDSHEQAYREAVEQLNALRLIAEDVEFETYDDAIVDSIGDIIALNITNPIPISGDLYRIMAAEPVHGQGSAWRISAAAHDDLIYSDEVEAGSHASDTVLPDASSIDGPTSLNATSSTEINIDGTPITSLNVTWTAATSIYVDRYQIEWKRSSDSDWQRAETQNTNFSIKPVIPSISYDIRVRTASQLVGIYSAWVSLTLSASGKGDIPAAPTSLSTLDTFYGIVLTWTNPAINDLSHIEIWRSADNNRANATHINDVIGTSYTDGNVGGTAYYWIRAVNTSEIASDWHPTSSTGGVAGTKSNLDSAASDTTAPTDPGSLSLTTGIEEATLAVIAWVKGTWSASTDDGILSGYQVQWWTSEDATKVSTFSPTGTTEYRIVPVKPGLTVSMRIRAEDWAGNVSNWTTTQTIVAASYGTPPANVTNATLTAGLDKLVARWTNPADESWLETEVYLGTASGFTPGSGNLKGTVRTDELVIADGLTNGTNYYAKFRTRGKGGESGYSTAVGPAAPFKITDLNIANYFETAAILNAYIQTLDAAKITTGTLSADRIGANTITAGKLNVSQLSAISADLGTVTAGILQGAIVRTSASGARVQLNSTNGVEAFNSSGTRTVHLSVDGSGYVGNAGAVSWDTAGTVTIPGTLISGLIVGNTIKTAVSGWRVTLNESGIPIRYWDGTSTHFSVDGSGNVDMRSVTIRDTNGNILLQSGGNLDYGRVGGTKPPSNADRTIDQIAGRGANIMNPRYTTFEEASLPPVQIGSDLVGVIQDSVGFVGTKSIRLQSAASGVTDGHCYLGSNSSNFNIRLTPNKKWIVSSWVRSNNANRPGGIRLRTSAGVFHGGHNFFTTSSTANTWTRVSIVMDLTSDSSTSAVMLINNNSDNIWVWFDGIMIEEAVGNQTTPSAYSEPPNFRVDYTGELNADRTANNAQSPNWLTSPVVWGNNPITSSNVSTFIANAAILNAQIGNIIQASATAGDGQPTWKLDKTGAIDARSITIRDTNGAVILQSGGNLDYARVGGTKPPSNADRTIDQIGGRGANVMNPRYTTFEEAGLPPVAPGGDVVAVVQDSVGFVGSKSIRIQSAGSGVSEAYCYLGSSASDANILLTPNKKWIASAWVRSNVANRSGGIRLRASNGVIVGGYNFFTTSGTANTWTRVSIVIDLTANASTSATMLINNNSDNVYLWFDGIMLEEAVGNQTAPSAYNEPPNVIANTDVVHVKNAITTSNITTFIASAAIGNAQIENAAVNTLQIAGNAVTVPVHAFTAGSLTVNSATYVTLQSVTINPQSAPVTLIFTASAYIGSQLVNVGAKVHRVGYGDLTGDISIIRTGGNTAVGASVSLSFRDTNLHNGATYEIRSSELTSTGLGASISNRSLIAIGTRR